jgi:hypothetical protein
VIQPHHLHNLLWVGGGIEDATAQGGRDDGVGSPQHDQDRNLESLDLVFYREPVANQESRDEGVVGSGHVGQRGER